MRNGVEKTGRLIGTCKTSSHFLNCIVSDMIGVWVGFRITGECDYADIS